MDYVDPIPGAAAMVSGANPSLLAEFGTELRRPFRLSGPMGRGVFALLALPSLALLALWIFLSAGPAATSQAANTGAAEAFGVGSLVDSVQRLSPWAMVAALLPLLPLMCTMVRRAHSVGIARWLGASCVGFTLAAWWAVLGGFEQPPSFPITRGVFVVVTAEAPNTDAKIGVAVLLFPVFLITAILDLLLILAVMLCALALMFLTLVFWAIIGLSRTRSERFAALEEG